MALVDPLVLVGHGFDDQVPLVRVGLVKDLEAVVADVHELADGQQVCVTVPNPGNLKIEKAKKRMGELIITLWL